MMNEKIIPFNIPYFSEKSTLEIQRVTESQHFRGDGKTSTYCNELISKLTGGGRSLLTPSCTAALEMSSLLMDLQPGDEVILPSFTFTSAALAIVNYGASPVFVDIDPKYKNIDVNQVLDSVSPRTKAISVVNYAGIGCDYYSLREICAQNDLYLIEDNAHGLGAKINGAPLGSFGDFATQSFHETKNLQCGEGGALIVNDPQFIEKAEIIREKGTDRSKFTRGEVNKYQWVDKGSSFLLSEILAGILWSQLQEFDFIQKRRQQIWEYYATELSGWSEQSDIRIMEVPQESEQSFHMFYCETQTLEQRNEVLAKLLNEGILAVFHYQSLHSSRAGKKYGRTSMELINSDKVSNTLFRLPLYYGLKDNELERIVDTIKSLQLSWIP